MYISPQYLIIIIYIKLIGNDVKTFRLIVSPINSTQSVFSCGSVWAGSLRSFSQLDYEIPQLWKYRFLISERRRRRRIPIFVIHLSQWLKRSRCPQRIRQTGIRSFYDWISFLMQIFLIRWCIFLSIDCFRSFAGGFLVFLVIARLHWLAYKIHHKHFNNQIKMHRSHIKPQIAQLPFK